ELQTNLYTHSYLYLGLTEARQQHYQRMFLAMQASLGGESSIDASQVLQDPCAPVNGPWRVEELKNKTDVIKCASYFAALAQEKGEEGPLCVLVEKAIGPPLKKGH
ncbi:hypothetical protein CYMTET_53058, partial [Cymbomonas tetramitiformis]